MTARYLTWAYTAPLSSDGRPTVAVQRAVLVSLAQHANTSGCAWPSSELMSSDTDLSLRSVKYALTALADQGRIIAMGRRSGGKRPTRWRLEPAAPDDPTVHHVHGSTVGSDEPNRAPRASNRAPGAPDPAVTRKNPQVTTTRSPKANEHDRAAALLRPWWERQQPRPQQPWPAAIKVLAKALRDGWTETELAQALDEIPTISGGALDYWRKRRGNSNRTRALTDEQHEAIHNLVQRGEAQKAKRRAGKK